MPQKLASGQSDGASAACAGIALPHAHGMCTPRCLDALPGIATWRSRCCPTNVRLVCICGADPDHERFNMHASLTSYRCAPNIDSCHRILVLGMNIQYTLPAYMNIVAVESAVHHFA